MDLKNVTQLYVSNKKFSEVQTLTQSKYLREKSFMDLKGLKPDTVFSILPHIKKNNMEKKSLDNVLSHNPQVNKSSIKNTKKERKEKVYIKHIVASYTVLIRKIIMLNAYICYKKKKDPS